MTENSREICIFRELTEVPRPTGHLSAIQDYLEGFADSHGLMFAKDAAGNVMIERKGRTGTIILQAHQDMVATVTPGKEFDFMTQPIKVHTSDGWMYAEDTTLGADDGAGIAIILAMLEKDTVTDVSLRCIFTVDEETALVGADAISPDWLIGDYLINVDSEDENEIIIGCAGSSNVIVRSVPDTDGADGMWYRMEISGLQGGHSAVDIDRGRGNALKIAASFLSELDGLKIASFAGGSASNVIPMHASVVFSSDNPYAVKRFDEYAEATKKRFSETDGGLAMDISPVPAPAECWSEKYSEAFVGTIIGCPDGVIEKGDLGVVTSCNCATVTESDGRIELCAKTRSARYESLVELNVKTKEILSRMGDVPEFTLYPCWYESKDSELLAISSEVYKETFGRKPEVRITHGGLECSLFRDKAPKLQMISVGPTMHGVHTPSERLEIASVGRMSAFIEKLLLALTE